MAPREAGPTTLLEAPPCPPLEVSAAVLPVFDIAIRAEPSCVEHARRITSAWLRQRCGMTEDRASVLLVVVSELCTNAVRHGRSESFGLRGRMRFDGQIRLEVRDWSPSAVPLPQHADLMDEGGRGLFLVQALVADELHGTWGFNGDATIAWCEVPLNTLTDDHARQELLR